MNIVSKSVFNGSNVLFLGVFIKPVVTGDSPLEVDSVSICTDPLLAIDSMTVPSTSSSSSTQTGVVGMDFINVVADSFSYSAHHFNHGLELLGDAALADCFPADILAPFAAVLSALETVSSARITAESLLGEIPDVFLDPIMFIRMRDPGTITLICPVSSLIYIYSPFSPFINLPH